MGTMKRHHDPKVDSDIRLLAALVLLTCAAAGCAGAETAAPLRAGGPYVEEIKSPAPRDSLRFDSDCLPPR